MNKSVLAIVLFLILGVLPVSASEISGTIQTGSQYGWGENMGWINFSPQYAGTYYGPVITDTSVMGYAWSQGVGWINFSPTSSGQAVSNTSDGHLSGYAWVSGLGWLSMNGITIDANGRFRGTTGDANSTVGRVNFDCDHCTVVTDWRPISARQQTHVVNNSTTGMSGSIALSPIASKKSSSSPVVATLTPSKTPLSTIDTTALLGGSTVVQRGGQGSAQVTLSDGGLVKVDFPDGTFEDGTTISITPQIVDQNDAPSPGLSTFLVHGVIFSIVATDRDGAVIHNLKKTIRISIDIPSHLTSTADLGAYYLNESNSQKNYWVHIPDAQLVNGKMVIQVDHLTRFAIFRTTNQSSTIATRDQKSRDIQYMYVVCIFVFVMLLGIVLRKRGKI